MRRRGRVGLLAGLVAAFSTAGTAEAQAAGCGLLGLFPCPKVQATPAPSTGGGSEPAPAPTESRRCGLLGLFTCPVTSPPPSTTPPPPPPDPALKIPAGGNPYNVQPLAKRTSPSQAIYPRAYGHIPVGVTDNGHSQDGPSSTAPAQAARAMGGRLARVNLHWPQIEPNDGNWQFGHLDQVYLAHIEQGIRPYFQVSGTPKWATDILERSNRCNGNYCHIEPVRTKARTHLRDLGRTVGGRYPLAGGFEYRNEPQLWTGRRPPIDPARYALGLQGLWEGVHLTNSTVPVVGGAMANVQGWTDYLRKVLAAGVEMDAVSVHHYDFHTPFTAARENWWELQTVLDDMQRSDLRVIVSEVGAPITPGIHGEQTWAEWPTPGKESVYERMVAYLQWLDTRAAGYVPPDPPLPPIVEQVDAIIYYNLVPEPGKADYGLLAYPADGTRLQPRDAWCRWRKYISGHDTWPGTEHIAPCSGSTPVAAVPMARSRAAAGRAWARR